MSGEADVTQDGELPEGWAGSTFGEVADVVGGGTPSSVDPSNFCSPGEGNPWLTPADLSLYDKKLITRGSRDLSDRGLTGSSAKLMPPGTVCMSSRAPIGYVVIAQGPISTNQGFKSFVLHPELSPDFYYYWIRFSKDTIESMGSGSTFNEISGSRCKEIPIPLAPLAEQRRIVAKLDAVLGKVDACRQRLDRIPAILKRFRQSVLAAACSGRLTKDWREGKEAIEPWRTEKLETCLREKLSNGRSVPTGIGFPVLRLTCLQAGRVDLAERKSGNWDRSEGLKFAVQKGDFFVSRGNGSLRLVGRGALLLDEPDEVAFPDTLIRIRLTERINPEFVAILWDSQGIRDQIERVAKTSAGIFKISQGDLNSITLPLPPLPEQHEIVRRVNALFALADNLEARYRKARAHVDKLTQSVLAKAFRGELVPTEAELARGEGREYEPAAALLERIQAERASQPAAVRKRAVRTTARKAAT